MTERDPVPTDTRRDSNQSGGQCEPVPAASSLGTDDEAGGASSMENRLAKAQEAEKKIGDAPMRHRR